MSPVPNQMTDLRKNVNNLTINHHSLRILWYSNFIRLKHCGWLRLNQEVWQNSTGLLCVLLHVTCVTCWEPPLISFKRGSCYVLLLAACWSYLWLFVLINGFKITMNDQDEADHNCVFKLRHKTKLSDHKWLSRYKEKYLLFSLWSPSTDPFCPASDLPSCLCHSRISMLALWWSSTSTAVLLICSYFNDAVFKGEHEHLLSLCEPNQNNPHTSRQSFGSPKNSNLWTLWRLSLGILTENITNWHGWCQSPNNLSAISSDYGAASLLCDSSELYLVPWNNIFFMFKRSPLSCSNYDCCQREQRRKSEIKSKCCWVSVELLCKCYSIID